MNDQEVKKAIEAALKTFPYQPLAEAALHLFEVLGYTSQRRLTLSPNNRDTFIATFAQGKTLNDQYALPHEWKSIDFLCQLTDDEIRATGNQQFLFDSQGTYNGAVINSYLFLALELQGHHYTRTALAGITRELNKLFDMPAMLLFKHGSALTLAVISRRLNKRDETRDVLEKVTLVKDITYVDPLRAHIEILHDLSLGALYEEFYFHNFAGLHQAWEKRLASYTLNERFYREVANWYFWALKAPDVVLPRSIQSIRNTDEREKQRSIFFIRLLTRLIFCWFLQEKGFVPRDLFRHRVAEALLKDPTPTAGTYYKAFLQNLFFATLNQEQDRRGWRKKYRGSRDGNRGVTNLWRYQDLLTSPDQLEALLRDRIPFVNGGIFECLDDTLKTLNVRLDDFSEEKDNRLCLPNELFFGEAREVDLSDVYEDARRKKEKVSGLIDILSRYKFTVEENTPLEEEIALDPELLGRVFENLLASYNEDTRTTARKALGAFYTPREIVSYMVDEVLLSYLTTQVPSVPEATIRSLFTADGEAPKDLSPSQKAALVQAIGNVKVFDPACGSGAFLMGALRSLVALLQKLDPNNESWKRDRLAEAEKYDELLRQTDAPRAEVAEVEARIDDIQRSFDTRFHALDFARKLYLIENCIYGVDIQPIAGQIAKLRFFIALIVDQKVDVNAPNFGVRPLPNLETKIVAADALMPAEKQDQHQFDLFDAQIKRLREGLELVRHEHFNARTPARKAKCRERDAELRKHIAEALQESGLPAPTASALAAWDPYDQNQAATFFDSAWMFSIKDGFDIVLGNPPYVRQEQIKKIKPGLKEHYESYTGTADLYVYFYERGIQLLREHGVFGFISSNKWFRAAYGEKLRTWLTAHTRLHQIIDFGDAPVFTSIAYPCIVILTKEEQNANDLQVLNWQPGPPVEQFVDIFRQQSFSLSQASLRPDGWQLESRVKLQLLERIRTTGTPLGDYVKGRFYYGIKTDLNEAFVIDRTTRDRLIAEHASSAEIIKPFLRGRDVKRWRIEPQDLWLIFTRRGIDLKKYPAIYTYLLPLKKRLMPGTPGGRKPGSYEWYEIQDNIAYWKEFEHPKVLYPDIYEHQSFAWDKEGFFAANTCYFIPTVEKWLTALLNSQTIEWFYSQVSNKVRGGYMRAFSDYMRLIPIPKISEANQGIIEKLVNYLLWLNRYFQAHITEKIARDALMLGYWEQVLNGLVCELYFPEELHARDLCLFDLVQQAGLPTLDAIPEAQRLSRLREEFERVYDLQHPLRAALHDLQTVEEVRIIEGKA